jgi:hypothetical protein
MMLQMQRHALTASKLAYRKSLAAGIVILVAIASFARAEEGSRLTDLGWLPGISLESGLLVQESDGRVDGSEFTPMGDERLFLTPELRLGLEVMSPVLSALPGRPRLFANAGLAVVFDGDRNLVKEGTPPGLDIPDLGLDRNGNPVRTPLAIVRGTGQATRTELDPLVFSAGLGMAWEVELWERTFRIKPSLQYRHVGVEVNALMSSAASLDASEECPCRSVVLDGSESDDYHALGPGFELEMEASRSESLLFTVFASVAAYRSLGNERTIVRVEGAFDDAPPTPADVTSVLDRDPWSYRVGLGLRLWWSPESTDPF